MNIRKEVMKMFKHFKGSQKDNLGGHDKISITKTGKIGFLWKMREKEDIGEGDKVGVYYEPNFDLVGFDITDEDKAGEGYRYIYDSGNDQTPYVNFSDFFEELGIDTGEVGGRYEYDKKEISTSDIDRPLYVIELSK